ncbi:MAG: tetratricopeptide repeat protein [Flavobacteriales bacterium]|nr:tetratricopeptide repeat protein [Flavobacteriales bacterium]
MENQFEDQNDDYEGLPSSPVVQRYIRLLKEKRDEFFDVEEFQSIIDHYVNLFDLEEASLAIEKGLVQHPESFDLSLRKAHIALLSGNIEDCLRVISSFELLHPNDEELMALKIEAYTYRGDHDKAIVLIENLLNSSGVRDRVKLNIQLAEQYTHKSNLLEAIAAWKNAIAADPQLELAHLELRQAFIKADIVEEGIRYFRKRTDEHPYSFPAWLELAECYLHHGEVDRALSAFDYALAIDEDHIIALAGKGSAFFHNDDYPSSLEVFKQLNGILPDDPTVICSIGECYEQLEEYPLANDYFLKALDISPEHIEARLGHAIVSEHLDDSGKALSQMETVVGLEPDNAEYWYIFAELLSRNDRFEKSQLCFERSLQLSDKKLEYRLGQIDALIRAGELETALDKVQVCFEDEGDQPIIYHRGIKVLYELGQRTECLVLLEMMLERHEPTEELRSYYPDIFEDSQAIELLDCDRHE